MPRTERVAYLGKVDHSFDDARRNFPWHTIQFVGQGINPVFHDFDPLNITLRPSKRNTDTRNMPTGSPTKKPLRQRAGALFQTRPRVDIDTPVQQRSSRRPYADHTATRVRFQDERKNKVYQLPPLTGVNPLALWYGKEDLALMKKRTLSLARSVLDTQQTIAHSFSQSLLRTYDVFATEETSAMEEALFLESPITGTPSNDMTHGLEKWIVLLTSNDDFAKRRQQLYRKMQTCEKPSELKIRQISENFSRPSRLIARHVAQTAAMAA